MPLIRRLPKRGFNNAAFKTSFALVNIGDLEEFDAGTRVTEQLLREKAFINGQYDGVKVLARGELTKSLTVEADKFSAAARQKIEQAGGSAIVVGK
jgi:large subunit ribosomal protein L15